MTHRHTVRRQRTHVVAGTKAWLMTTLCQFVEWFCHFKQLERRADERERLMESSSLALNLFMKLLHVSDVWIETNPGNKIASAGRHFWRLTLA